MIAPGAPGIPPRWTSSAKSGVGTATGNRSRVWFPLSHGIVNEVYFPRLDQANTRDCGLIVTDGRGYFSEEKRHAASAILPLAQGVPGYRVANTCLQKNYRIEKTVVTDPARDVLLQRVRFEALHGRLTDYHLYVLLAPHIGNCGYGNHGWVGEYNGVTMLFAERDGTCLALACSTPFAGLSCGYVGASDGWRTVQDTPTIDTGIGVHYVDLPTGVLPPGTEIRFTFFWPEADHWEGMDFSITAGGCGRQSPGANPQPAG